MEATKKTEQMGLTGQTGHWSEHELRPLLLKAFNEVAESGQIKCIDVERVLTKFNTYPDIPRKLDQTLIKKCVNLFHTGTGDKDKVVHQEEFINQILPLLLQTNM